MTQLSPTAIDLIGSASERGDDIATPPKARGGARKQIQSSLIASDYGRAVNLPKSGADLAWFFDGDAPVGIKITEAGFAAAGFVRPEKAKPARKDRQPRVASEPKVSKAKAADEAAARGELPAPPDFTADTHKPYRGKLANMLTMVSQGDVEGLKAVVINPTSTSPRALIRYRDRAVIAIEARNAQVATNHPEDASTGPASDEIEPDTTVAEELHYVPEAQ